MAIEISWELFVNLLGCSTILIALFLSQTGRLPADTPTSIKMNIAGGGMLAIGSTYQTLAIDISYLPFCILNSVWFLVSAGNFLVAFFSSSGKPPRDLELGGCDRGSGDAVVERTV